MNRFPEKSSTLKQNGGIVIHRVKLDRSRSRSLGQVLETISRKQYLDPSVVAGMLCGEGEEVDVYFLNLGRDISDNNLEKEDELCGLKSDPYAQAMVNQSDPSFANSHPNATHWRNSSGKWCF